MLVVVVVAIAAAFIAPQALACATCFVEPGSPQSDGMNMAILTLLGFAGVALASAVGFVAAMVLRIRKLDREAAYPVRAATEGLS